MKVKLFTIMAGPNGVYDAGAIVELPEDQAEELIRTNQAERIGRAPTRTHAAAGETATAEPPAAERAVSRTTPKRRQARGEE